MTDQADRLREMVRQLKQGEQQTQDQTHRQVWKSGHQHPHLQASVSIQENQTGDVAGSTAALSSDGMETAVNSDGDGEQKETRVIAITSGKGGVGKTNFVLNFALALQKLGRRVVIWDADFGFANVHVLMGKTPEVTLLSLLRGEGDIWQAISPGVEGLQYISGGQGMKEMFHLTDDKLEHFLAQFMQLRSYADYLLIDLGAGLNNQSLNLLLAADEIILLATPEPPSLTDAYAVLKLLSLEEKALRVHLLINRAKNEREGMMAHKRMAAVTERFLSLSLHRLGILPDDPHVVKAVHKQTPYLLAYPNSLISRKTFALAEYFIQFNPFADEKNHSVGAFTYKRGFWGRFRQLFHPVSSISQGKR